MSDQSGSERKRVYLLKPWFMAAYLVTRNRYAYCTIYSHFAFLRRSKDQKRKEREVPGAAPAACGERGVRSTDYNNSFV